jgi:hypothetical protein
LQQQEERRKQKAGRVCLFGSSEKKMIAECQGGGGGDFLIKLFGKTIPVPESGDAKVVYISSCLFCYYLLS